MTPSKDSGYTSQCLLGVWKDGEMVEIATTKPTLDYRPSKMLTERIDTNPEMITELNVREFDLFQLDRLESILTDFPNLRGIELNFKYHRGHPRITSEIESYLTTDFLSEISTLEDVSFDGPIHSPQIKTIDFSGLCKLPNLASLYVYETTNLRWLDLSPLSRSKSTEKIVINSHAKEPMMYRKLNLSGLGKCQSLERLLISGPYLDELDLSPLDGSRSLRKLTIINVNTHVDEDWDDYMNKISTDVISSPVDSADKMLDLKIPRCENLKTLLISEYSRTNIAVRPTTSKFKSIDLANLEHAEHLRRLQIEGQGIHQLDLSPLINLQELLFIDITDNDNLTEIDISAILPMAERLRQCRFDKYATRMVFDEESQRGIRTSGELIRYKASKNMDIFYDAFKPKFTSYEVKGDSIVDEPIDIEWY
jgi:hypothetical protein